MWLKHGEYLKAEIGRATANHSPLTVEDFREKHVVLVLAGLVSYNNKKAFV